MCWVLIWRFHSFFEPKVDVHPYVAKGQGNALEFVGLWPLHLSLLFDELDEERFLLLVRFRTFDAGRGDVTDRLAWGFRRRRFGEYPFVDVLPIPLHPFALAGTLLVRKTRSMLPGHRRTRPFPVARQHTFEYRAWQHKAGSAHIRRHV